MAHHLDAEFAQFVAVADAGQHQDLRRLDRAGAHDDLAPSPQDFPPAVLPILGADGLVSLDQYPQHARPALDAEIGSFSEVRMDIGARGAATFAVLLRHLVEAEALLLGSVEILADREAGLACRLQEDPVKQVVGAQSGDVERAGPAVPFAAEILVAFGLLEIGKNVGERPAFVPERRPMVIVRTVPTGVDHGVDRRRSAERSAARLVSAPPVEAALRHGLERPIVDARRNHEDAGERRVDDPAVARAACFQQADRDARILAQPAGDRAAGGTGAQHQIVELVHRASSNDQAQQPDDPVEGRAIGWQQEIETAQSRLVEDWLLLAEGAEAPFAMVAARARRSDAAKRLMLLGDVQETIVHGDAARNGVTKDPIARLAVGSEPIERQRSVMVVDEGDRLLDPFVRNDREDRPEDLLAADQHVVAGREDQAWGKLTRCLPLLQPVGSAFRSARPWTRHRR